MARKKSEERIVVTVPELLERLRLTEERAVLFEKQVRDACLAWVETRNPNRVVQALGLTNGRRGNSKPRETILPLYCAAAQLTTPRRALRVIAKSFRFSSEIACCKTLLRWREQVRVERRRLTRKASSGASGDRAALNQHRVFVDIDFSIPSPTTLEPRADTRIRRA